MNPASGVHEANTPAATPAAMAVFEVVAVNRSTLE